MHGYTEGNRQARCFTKRSIAASVGRIRNSSFACTGLALHRINFVSCPHWLLHRGEACSVAGRTVMLFDLRRHDGPSRPPQLAALPGNGLSSHKMPRETVGNDGGTIRVV